MIRLGGSLRGVASSAHDLAMPSPAHSPSAARPAVSQSMMLSLLNAVDAPSAWPRRRSAIWRVISMRGERNGHVSAHERLARARRYSRRGEMPVSDSPSGDVEGAGEKREGGGPHGKARDDLVVGGEPVRTLIATLPLRTA